LRGGEHIGGDDRGSACESAAGARRGQSCVDGLPDGHMVSRSLFRAVGYAALINMIGARFVLLMRGGEWGLSA
jgi:hypothetical protein